MGELEQQNVIDGIFDGLKNIVVVHDNEEYLGSDSEWIRVCVQSLDNVSGKKGGRITLGDNPLYRYYSLCFVQIFVKPDTGIGRTAEIADMIVQMIRDKYIEGLQFSVPNVIKVGEVKGWHQTNIVTEFYRED